MLDLEIKYRYNDVSIVPTKISYINHRFDVNPLYDYCMLPIFAAPMSSIYVKNDTVFWLNDIYNIVHFLKIINQVIESPKPLNDELKKEILDILDSKAMETSCRDILFNYFSKKT